MKSRPLLTTFVAGLLVGSAAVAIAYLRAVPPGRDFPAAQPRPKQIGDRAPSPAGKGDVYIDPAMLQNLGVRSVVVAQHVIAEPIRTTGYVNYDERRVVQINARISGWIGGLTIAYIGQQVRKGQRLLEIYSPELVLTEEDYLRSRALATGVQGKSAAQSDGQALMAAARSRLRLMGVPRSEVERLERTGEVRETVPLGSTANGVVTQIKAVEGGYVHAGEDLYTIADLAEVWVYADVYERELPRVKSGQKAEVISDALPGRIFRGSVSYIYPNVNEQTRTVRVRLEFPNPSGLLKPGMYVKTTLVDESPEKLLAVPTEAVLNSGVRHIVILDKGAGHFEPREITVGSESGGYFSVLKGLREGEHVVISAQFLIDSESNLHEALEAMAPGAESQPTSGTSRPKGH